MTTKLAGEWRLMRNHNSLARSKTVFQAVFLLLCTVVVGGVHAQTSTVGTITGTVRDSNGAVIPKAEIVILEERTGFTRSVKTNEDGVYLAASLPLGRYTVTASPAGFKKTVNSGLNLHVNENLVANLTLEVGAMSDTVTVTADSVQVETRSGDVSSLIAEKQVTELPLDGRNYAALVTMVPGVSPALGGNFAVRGTGLDSQ